MPERPRCVFSKCPRATPAAHLTSQGAAGQRSEVTFPGHRLGQGVRVWSWVPDSGSPAPTPHPRRAVPSLPLTDCRRGRLPGACLLNLSAGPAARALAGVIAFHAERLHLLGQRLIFHFASVATRLENETVRRLAVMEEGQARTCGPGKGFSGRGAGAGGRGQAPWLGWRGLKPWFSQLQSGSVRPTLRAGRRVVGVQSGELRV